MEATKTSGCRFMDAALANGTSLEEEIAKSVAEGDIESHLKVIRNWTRVAGYYLLVRTNRSDGANLYARTRSAVTAAKLLKFGFLGVDTAWKIYRKRVKDFDLYT